MGALVMFALAIIIESLIRLLKFTEKDRFNHRLSFLVLQKILHGLVYLAVFETVEVDLGGSYVRVAHTFTDNRYVYSRPF